ncbi:hypothetical protein [Fibrobacter sp.]|uniref:hypothetical protein n=1 Tax=Fibrobacter sp. TaxID=35828 RepID=UPI00388E9139
MKKRHFVLLSCLAVLLSSCIFDTDDSTLSRWLSDQGLPDSYKVQTLSVENLNVLSAETFLDTTPRSANDRAIWGHQANLLHDLVFDFAFIDSAFFADLKKSDSARALIALYNLRPFYSSKNYPSDSLPLKEDLDIKVSWKLDAGSKKAFVDSIGDITDSAWYADLTGWEADGSADTSYSLSLKAKDTLVKLDLPNALVESMKDIKKACHLQLRLSIPEAARAYRFYGAETDYSPIFQVRTLSDTNFKSMYPFRMAGLVSNEETCSDCQVLHGGVMDSLVVEFSSKEVLAALEEFYGDDFPYVIGDSNDVRQAVVLAQMTFARDDSEGFSELGKPIQVVVGSFVDSADAVVRKMEAYDVNRKLVDSVGHPNMVFYDGDSLSLQVTYGLRDFLNKASDGRTFKMMMRLGYPVLAPMDSLYTNYINDKGDSIYVFFSHFDYARYDFTSMMKSPVTLKLWLATKRGDEE